MARKRARDNPPKNGTSADTQTTKSQSSTDGLSDILAKLLASNPELRQQLMKQLNDIEKPGTSGTQQSDASKQNNTKGKHKKSKSAAIKSKNRNKSHKNSNAKSKPKKQTTTAAVSDYASSSDSSEGDISPPRRKQKLKLPKSHKQKLTEKTKILSQLLTSDESDCESSESFESISSDGESDSNDKDLTDLGLLSELSSQDITEKWKKKIWKREYIDFNKLYYGKDDSQVHMHIKESKFNSVTSLSRKPQRKITNILSWSRAFQLFASIYCIKYPEESFGMFQYMTLIQTMAKKSLNLKNLPDLSKFQETSAHKQMALTASC